MPSLQELISGDLIAGALLALLLSFIFQWQIISLFVHPNGVIIDSCTVSWPIGRLRRGRYQPPTLSFLDLIQTLLYLPLGLLILALTATVSGLGALQGVNENHSQDSLVMMKPNPTGTGAVATDVTATIIDTLRSALNRRLRLLLTNLALAFRYIGWPVLLFVATYGVAELSTNSQHYLHSPRFCSTCLSSISCQAPGWGLAAVVGLVLSAALMLFRWRVVDNTMRFIGLVGFIVLLTFWIFSLALWGFNQLLINVNVSQSDAI